MIRVRFAPRCVALEGHAGYGPRGADIVCAAVSTLVYVQTRLLEKQGALASYAVAPGRVVLRLSDEADLSVLELGLRWLAGEYPHCVCVEQQERM